MILEMQGHTKERYRAVEGSNESGRMQIGAGKAIGTPQVHIPLGIYKDCNSFLF